MTRTGGPAHVPQRRCVACGRRGPQGDFIRLKLDQAGVPARVVVDDGRARSGRGAYLCRRRVCLDQAVRRKVFARAFRRAVEVDVEELLSKFEAGVDEAT